MTNPQIFLLNTIRDKISKKERPEHSNYTPEQVKETNAYNQGIHHSLNDIDELITLLKGLTPYSIKSCSDCKNPIDNYQYCNECGINHSSGSISDYEDEQEEYE
jgi:hypothetical protein